MEELALARERRTASNLLFIFADAAESGLTGGFYKPGPDPDPAPAPARYQMHCPFTHPHDAPLVGHPLAGASHVELTPFSAVQTSLEQPPTVH